MTQIRGTVRLPKRKSTALNVSDDYYTLDIGRMDNATPDGENGENGGKDKAKRNATFSGLIELLHNTSMKIHGQNIKTPAAVKVKTEVYCDLIEAVECAKELRNALSDNAPTSFNAITEQLKELNASLKESTKVKTYAQATAPTPTTTHVAKTQKVREQRALLRQERAKYEVTLTTASAPDKTRKSLSTMSHKDITERFQSTINANVQQEEKPKLFGVSKATEDHIRIRYKTEQEAKLLRQLNWETAFEGLSVRKPKYGIVIHTVPKDEFNLLIDTDKTTIERLEHENTVPIVKVAPLRRKENKKATQHHSIVIFTTDPHAADRCINHGFHINYLLYPAEKYTPQLQITQCFKCGNYGHRAAQCKQGHQCGRCGEDHPTHECKSKEEPKCNQCNGKHENWHHECRVRITESRRLKQLGQQVSPYFTS